MITIHQIKLTEDQIAAVNHGTVVPAFEAAVATHCLARHAVAVSNATAGLHLACLTLGLGPGDMLWTSAITFVASANCAGPIMRMYIHEMTRMLALP